jgi:hypothetical protein
VKIIYHVDGKTATSTYIHVSCLRHSLSLAPSLLICRTRQKRRIKEEKEEEEEEEWDNHLSPRATPSFTALMPLSCTMRRSDPPRY